jgi:hypothetical protein
MGEHALRQQDTVSASKTQSTMHFLPETPTGRAARGCKRDVLRACRSSIGLSATLVGTLGGAFDFNVFRFGIEYGLDERLYAGNYPFQVQCETYQVHLLEPWANFG